jgi:hypothetical protein
LMNVLCYFIKKNEYKYLFYYIIMCVGYKLHD